MSEQAHYNAKRIRLFRGSILYALLSVYPNSAFRSMLTYLATTLELEATALDREVAYMVDRGWITVEDVSRSVLGRSDKKLRLTAVGYDIAQDIDPNMPLTPEDV